MAIPVMEERTSSPKIRSEPTKGSEGYGPKIRLPKYEKMRHAAQVRITQPTIPDTSKTALIPMYLRENLKDCSF